MSLNHGKIKKMLPEFVRSFKGSLTSKLDRSDSELGLGQLPSSLTPAKTTTSVCGFCATGCALRIHLDDQGEAINISPATEYSVNLGMACPKGWEALTPLKAKDRALSPMKRTSAGGKLQKISWKQGLDEFTDRMKAVQDRHGPASVAFLSTGQIPFEEMAALGMLTKFGMGVVHGDGNTRQCMATAAIAYKQSFGFDSPPYTYQDFEESDVLVFIGANPCIAHPIMWEHVDRNKNNPEIIVIDPRKTETAMCSTQHYALEPKSDLVLLYAVAREIIEQGLIDKAYIENHVDSYDEFREFVQKYTLDYAAKKSGLESEQIWKLARTIGEGKRVSFWWTMGVNQSYEGVRVAQSIINLALMTGNMGRPGTGANSITGQCNAMGSRLFSNTTNLLGGHDFLNADHRKKVANGLGIDEGLIPQENSKAYDQIIEGIKEGKIKALWVIATNGAHTWINRPMFRELRKKLEFLVVQDMYHTTETADWADLVLPAAGWGEKEGCFINSERRIGRIKKVAKAPGEALSDFHIFKLISSVWGSKYGIDVLDQFKKPEDVFKKLKELTVGQPCDISGIPDWDYVDKMGGVQWPLKHVEDIGDNNRRLFEDGKYYTANSRAKMVFEESKPLPEPTNKEYPITLLTGRGTSAQWHSQTRSSKSAVLKKLYPQVVYAEIHPETAKKLDVISGDWVYVSSRRGKIKVKANVTSIVQKSQIFIPMHYVETNELTFPAFDPNSRQPSYKACAVRIDKLAVVED